MTALYATPPQPRIIEPLAVQVPACEFCGQPMQWEDRDYSDDFGYCAVSGFVCVNDDCETQAYAEVE